MAEPDPVTPPDAVFIRARWISKLKRDYAADCNRILTEHGAVYGDRLYPKRRAARYRAQYLRDLLIRLNLREPWEVGEHVEKTPGGYRWAVEYLGKHGE